MIEQIERKPSWLRKSFKNNKFSSEFKKTIHDLGLITVCEKAMCPNRNECFSKKKATFMMLGSICTRNCTFCNISSGKPQPPDPQEPKKIALAINKISMHHAVITSVTRDDLFDGGANYFATVISEIREKSPGTIIEVLIPDFQGDYTALKKVIEAKPHIINHNLETVSELYFKVRPEAVYQRSLTLLKRVKEMAPSIHTKSGIMLGLGETKVQVLKAMSDLLTVQCDFLTIGQYLQPSKKHHAVIQYIHPSIFEQYRINGLKMGFQYIASAPNVRSSYQAEEDFINLRNSCNQPLIKNPS